MTPEPTSTAPALPLSVVATLPPRSPVAHFARWVRQSCPEDARVLNIGAGNNLSGPLDQVRERAAHLVGVDPDVSILGNRDVDERHHLSLEDYAATAPAPFDVAFSVFVLEHVAHPRAFTDACAAVVRPGGVLLGMTVNKWHYFGLSTWITTRLHVADRLLPRLRPAEQVGAYHFATEYRLNTARAITRHLRAAGFTSVSFRYWDLPAMYEPYLPGPTKKLAARYTDLVYRVGQPQLMGNLTFKATRL